MSVIMKVNFLIPPPLEPGKVPDRLFGCAYSLYQQPNIFMLYPAAVLEKAGYKVEYTDSPIENKNNVDFDSDVYVFYTTFLAEEIDLHWASEIRNNQQNAIVIFTGPEPTSRPEDFVLDHDTFVIRGETEKIILEFMKELQKKSPNFSRILGLSWMSNGKVINNPARPQMVEKELDSLPFPARHLIKYPEKYYNPKLVGRPSTVILTSRQCWGRCIYCLPSSYTFARQIEHKNYFGTKFTNIGLRSAENVIAEFKKIKKQGYKAVAVIDDNFINGSERMEKIFKGIKSLGMEWGCLSRADMLKDEKLVELMAEAGCTYVDIGVESFDQRVLDFVKKDLKVEDNIKAIKTLQKYGIGPKINILLGASPVETEESIKRTVVKLIELNVDYVAFAIVLPHRDTELYKIAKKNKWFVTRTGDYEPISPTEGGIISFPGGLTNKDYLRLLNWCYRRFYLRPGFLLHRVFHIRSLRQLKESIATAINLFSGKMV